MEITIYLHVMGTLHAFKGKQTAAYVLPAGNKLHLSFTTYVLLYTYANACMHVSI